MAHSALPHPQRHPAAPRPRFWARVTAVLHRIIGVPDYQRYVDHMKARHPDQPVLSCEDFQRERLADRYSRPGSRCC